MKGLFCLFERRPIMEKKRKDSRGRVLRKGETFREKEGRYSYEYKDTFGNRKTIYSVDCLPISKGIFIFIRI